MRGRALLHSCLLSCCLVGLAFLVPGAGAMVPEDILDMRTAEPGDLSPDGRYLLYSVGVWDQAAETRRRTLYRRDLESGEDLVLFTPEDRSWGAVWRPDGRAVAYLRAGDDGVQVWLMAADGADRRRLSVDDGGFGTLHWAPDGSALAWVASTDRSGPEAADRSLAGRHIVADRVGYRHLGEGFRRGKLGQLFVMDLANGRSRRVVAADLDVRALSWSPDSRRLVFEAKAADDLGLNLNSDLFLVDRNGGQVRRLTENPGPDSAPRWFEKDAIAWLRAVDPLWESAPRAIAVMDPGQGDAGGIQLFGAELDQFFWRWIEHRGRFYALAARGGALDLVELGESSVRWITDFQHDFWSLQAAGGRMILQGVSQMHPGAIYSVSLGERGTRQEPERIIDPNADWVNRVGLTAPEAFHVEVDGRRIECWAFLPDGLVAGQRAPVVLSIHGGPEWMYGGYFLSEFHILPSFGYGVVLCNPTGSTGYGYEFQADIRGDWVDRPAREVLACLQAAVDAGWADPDRAAVLGGSYGGLLGAELTTREPAIFRAAALDRMYPDQDSFWGATDEKWFPEWEFGGRPWDEKARPVYERNSPWRRVDRVTTPTLVSQGHLDFRCPDTGGHMWFTALKARGVPARFIRFEQEGHGIRDPRNQVFYQHQLLNWFERHVLGLERPQGKEEGESPDHD